jgi:hypothetical protein
MIDELGETLNILGDSAGLFDLEQLTDESFMLVTVKAIMERMTKCCPSGCDCGVVDGFILARGHCPIGTWRRH